MLESVGKSVRLFLADGTPGGLVTAEIMNWTGHVVAAPRSGLASLLNRPESARTGVYLLLGEDPEALGGQRVYVGEGDNIGRRLVQHARPQEQGGKDDWDRAVVLTSKDMNLTKAHARYLESGFIMLATATGRAELGNGTAPAPLSLPEADESDMEQYIEQAKIVLPVLGINVFRSLRSVGDAATSVVGKAGGGTESPLFEMRIARHGLTAHAQDIDGEFTVLAGSGARPRWSGVAGSSYASLWEALDRDGTLAPTADGTARQFSRDHVFASVSAAAAVVAGRSANGRLEWRVQATGRTYGQWQSEGFEEALQRQGDPAMSDTRSSA